MTHINLKLINGAIYVVLGLCMLFGAMGGILQHEVRPMDVGVGYTLSAYVTDTVLLQNGFGLILVFGGILLLVKGIFMILHAIVDKNKQKITPPPHPFP